MAILSIQSHVAYGHVGNAAAVFVLQRLGHEVWPVHTVQYSNHKGYGGWSGTDFSGSHVTDIVEGIAARGVLASCEAVLSGYVGRAEIGAAIVAAVKQVRRARPDALFLCDPVMGDDEGGLYVADDMPAYYRERALAIADIITPNRFELELLSGQRVTTLKDALTAARALLALGPKVVLVTSLRHTATDPGEIEMLAVAADQAVRVRTPYLHFDPAPNGSGDSVAALFLAAYLAHRDVAQALAGAAAAIYPVMQMTAQAGTRELRLIAAQNAFAHPPRTFAVETIAT